MKIGWRPLALIWLLALLGGASALQCRTPPPNPPSEPASGSGATGEFVFNATTHYAVRAAQRPTLGAASFQTTTMSIPTYPYVNFLEEATDEKYNITYRYLKREEYENSNPTPTSQDYTMLVLENAYLRVTLLPELGGRIYQMIFKPTGHNELYQNPTLKPTHWGPLNGEENWWLAVGGIEWCLPVEEHGYEWGEPWAYQVFTSTAGVTVTLQDTAASDRIRAAVTVHLPAERCALEVTPRVENPTGKSIAYKYWLNGMLSPGAANTVGADLQFVFGADQVTVHSSGDFDEYEVLDWPLHDGRDYSFLGNWNHWLGFFERPQAQGEFAGVYDTAADEGMARIFPSSVARGSKGFGFGWADPIDWRNWTDDGSTYVELHGGVAPTFWETATLAAGESLEWTEYWYPLHNVGRLSAATLDGALGVYESDGKFHIGVHSTTPRAAGASVLYAWNRSDCAELAHWRLPALAPDTPFTTSIATGGRALENMTFAYLDGRATLLAAVNSQDCLPPTSSVEPLPSWVETTTFTVAWTGHDVWSGVAAYDVQVRDGYTGAWTDWQTDTLTSSSLFTGVHGHTYFFRARARDTEGNWELYDDGEWRETFTTVLTKAAPVLVTSRKSAAPQRPRPNQAVVYTIFISNTGSSTATVAMTDTLPAEMIVLTETLTSTTVHTPTYANGQIYWCGTVEADAAIRVTYTLCPTMEAPFGVPLTNTVEIIGSVLGDCIRRESVTRMHFVWLPLIVKKGKW